MKQMSFLLSNFTVLNQGVAKFREKKSHVQLPPYTLIAWQNDFVLFENQCPCFLQFKLLATYSWKFNKVSILPNTFVL
jgi:hypothetical protein